MKYQFRPNENKIYDAFIYPNLIHFKEDQMQNSEQFDTPVQKDYCEICMLQNKMLSPYKSRLEAYYYTDFNLIMLLFLEYPLWGYASAEDYLGFLEKQNEKSLQKAVLVSLIEKVLDRFHEAESQTLATELIENPIKLMDWLDGASISSDSKWHIMRFLKAPKESIQTYRALLKEISPLFETFYTEHSSTVANFQIDFENRLKQIEGDAVSSLTNGIVKDNHFGDGECILLISVVEPYTIHIYPNAHKYFASWGLEVENLMRRALAENENQLADRVMMFKNLGDRTKYDCLRCIAEGMTSTKKIAEKLGVSSATISYHLNTLLTAKLIDLEQQQGRYKHVINKNHVLQSLEGLKDDLKIN